MQHFSLAKTLRSETSLLMDECMDECVSEWMGDLDDKWCVAWMPGLCILEVACVCDSSACLIWIAALHTQCNLSHQSQHLTKLSSYYRFLLAGYVRQSQDMYLWEQICCKELPRLPAEFCRPQHWFIFAK